MKFLHLDPQFTPYGKSIHFDQFTFSGGEPHLKIHEALDPMDQVMITQRVKSFNDMGFILLAHDALTRMGVKHLELFIPYFPAARQDRLMVTGEPLSVKVMARIINSMELQRVQIFDPHSEVTPALIENAEVISNYGFVQEVAKTLDEFCLVSPDGGALKKIYGIAQHLGGIEVIEGSKVRDVATGALKDFKVYAEDLSGKTCLVVDDICDGGGTFIGLAKELRRLGAEKLVLAVSHGIFSKGINELNKYYDEIFCTDAFSTLGEGYKGVKQLRIDQF